jgi:hypothetical protein
MASWFRSWHGAPTDTKWLAVAQRAKVTPGMVSAIAWALFDHASQAKNRGSVTDFDVETYAAFSQFEQSCVTGVMAAMQEKGVILPDGQLANWDKRQPKREREDDSAPRVQALRERKRAANVTPNVTPSNAMSRPTDTDNREQITENREQRTDTETPCVTSASAPSLAWQAWVDSHGPNLTKTDSDLVREEVLLYGDDNVAEAIRYCNVHKNQPFVRMSYVQKVLSGWQADGTFGMHSGNGNSTPKPKIKTKVTVTYPDGTSEEREV